MKPKDDPGSSIQSTLTYTRISISNCISLDGEISDRALKILDAFPSAYMEMNSSRTGIDILVVGERPKWCKSNKFRLDGRETVELYFDTDWIPESGESFSNTIEEEVDHTEALEGLCSEHFPQERKLFYSDKEEIFEEPSKETKVHPYIQQKIRKVQDEYLSVIWDNPADLLIMLAILDRFLEKGCEYEGYDLKGDVDIRDIRLKTGFSLSQISERLNYLHMSNYPLTIVESKTGSSRRYRLSSSHTLPKRYLSRLKPINLEGASNNRNNSKGFYPYIVMFGNRRILNFTLLSAFQKYLIMLLNCESFHVSDLYENIGYKGNRDNFRKHVLKGLLDLGLIVEKKKVLYLAEDIEDRILDIYEEDRERRVQEEVAKDREVYKEKILYGDVDEDVRDEILKNRGWSRR